jgi:ornithine cyclodeaminase/alanine dehydrogenase-like protein (mu-crystallin family)
MASSITKLATRQIRPAAESYVLSYVDVAQLLGSLSLTDFLDELAREIEAAYVDPTLRSIDRIGWPYPPDTLEIMGCRASDYTCIKMISSRPSVADPTVATVTGTLLCTDSTTDLARLVCDAAVLTPLRTAASTAVVMQRLVPSAEVIGVIGAGLEGKCHALTLAALFESVREIRFLDTESGQAKRARDEVLQLLKRETALKQRGIRVSALADERAVFDVDVIVTATYGATAVVNRGDVRNEGVFIAAIGADLDGKRELDHGVYDQACFVADDLAQCLREGELQHAGKRLGVKQPTGSNGQTHKGVLASGRIMGVADLLGDGGERFQRRTEPITVYDSTGFSGQDLAVSRLVLRLLEETRSKPRRAAHSKSRKWNPAEALSLVELVGRARTRAAPRTTKAAS